MFMTGVIMFSKVLYLEDDPPDDGLGGSTNIPSFDWAIISFMSLTQEVAHAKAKLFSEVFRSSSVVAPTPAGISFTWKTAGKAEQARKGWVRDGLSKEDANKKNNKGEIFPTANEKDVPSRAVTPKEEEGPFGNSKLSAHLWRLLVIVAP
ncbi:hypothetical protein R3P38DRAFT_2793895 [Favolaschia claudopus]|uniref:Uncharacterized protein n=1 Tax=Favolaschia claudopus TaxID=2862362 RepID=A0AAW0AC72_9AGAR